MCFCDKAQKEEKGRKKEREKRNLSLLGFKTLNIKSRDQNFSSSQTSSSHKLRTFEGARCCLTTNHPFLLFAFSFFVAFCRQRDDVNDVGGTTFLKREVVGWYLLSSLKKKEREFRALSVV